MNTELLSLFSVPVFRSKLDKNTSDFFKNELLPGISEELDSADPPEDWATDNLRTDFPGGGKWFDEKRDVVDPVLNSLLVHQFDNRVSFEVSGKIWFNWYEEGSYQEIHDHVPDDFKLNHFACIYFLSYDEEVHTPVDFMDPLHQIRRLSYQIPGHESSVYDWYTPEVSEGTFLMVPSFLYHRVKPQKKSSKKPRVTISFNVNARDLWDPKYEAPEWNPPPG